MVKLEEVEDEELDQAQPGPIEDSDDDGDYVDTGISPYCKSLQLLRVPTSPFKTSNS